MKKLTQNYEQLAVAAGLRFDGARNILYGQRNGFQVIVYAADPRYPYLLTVVLGAKSPMGVLDKSAGKQFAKGEKAVVSLNQEGNTVTMVLKNTPNQEKLCDNFNDSMNALTSFLKSRGYEPCCQFCGQQQVMTSEYDAGGDYMHLCPDCAGRLRQNMALAKQQKQQKKENLVGGIVGALLGSVIGAVCIIFFGQMNRVAVVSGIIMAVCAIKGYELLGGRLTKKGVVISIIMMIVMTYVGDRLDWAILIAREFDTDLFTGFRLVPALLQEGIIDSATYWFNLILLYVFTVIGAVPTIRANLKERKKESKFGQIGVTNNY